MSEVPAGETAQYLDPDQSEDGESGDGRGETRATEEKQEAPPADAPEGNQGGGTEDTSAAETGGGEDVQIGDSQPAGDGVQSEPPAAFAGEPSPQVDNPAEEPPTQESESSRFSFTIGVYIGSYGDLENHHSYSKAC